MVFEKHTTQQLKKYNKILLGIMIFGLFVMCFVTGIELYKISNQEESTLIYLVPTVIAPIFTIVPLIFSSLIGSEIKRRERGNS